MEPTNPEALVRAARARREADPVPEDEAGGRWTLAHLALEAREAELAAFQARARLQKASDALQRQRSRRPDPAPETGLQAELRAWVRSR